MLPGKKGTWSVQHTLCLERERKVQNAAAAKHSEAKAPHPHTDICLRWRSIAVKSGRLFSLLEFKALDYKNTSPMSLVGLCCVVFFGPPATPTPTAAYSFTSRAV